MAVPVSPRPVAAEVIPELTSERDQHWADAAEAAAQAPPLSAADRDRLALILNGPGDGAA